MATVHHSSIFLKTSTTDETFQQSGKQDSFRHTRRVHLVCMKVQAHSSSELKVTGILCSFRLLLGEKTSKEIPRSSRLEFLEKFLANNFDLSNAEDNTSRPLNREGIADLPFLRALLAICQRSQKPSFWEVMDPFYLVGYANLADSRTLLQQLLACLNFPLGSEDLFCWYKQKKLFYELWQQHKLLKTMDVTEV